jgi:hypothetical protein
MNLPNIPGFAAEASLHKKIGRHDLGVATGLDYAGQVVPQLRRRCVQIPIFHTVVIDCGPAGCPAHPGYEIQTDWIPVCWDE